MGLTAGGGGADLVQDYKNTSAELLERMFKGVSATHPVQTRRLQALQQIPLYASQTDIRTKQFSGIILM